MNINGLARLLTRAVIELDAASRFIKENNLEEMTVDYDGMTCDGDCLAEEAASTSEELSKFLPSKKDGSK